MVERIVTSYSKGITNTPSDFICSDGELAECVNLEVKNGELVPFEMPVRLGVYMEEGEMLVLVHNMKTFGKNYFTISNGVLRSFKVVDSFKEYYSISVNCGNVKSIQSVGNTVIVYTENQVHYIVYTDGMYKYLGNSLPVLGLSFSLSGNVVVSDSFEVDIPSLDNNLDPDLSSEENKKSLTEQIIPEVNKFIASESEENGLFIFPFLVRYAYRLFDGNYVMQSSPVLMMPSTTMAPICGYIARQDKRPPFHTFIAAVLSKLTFRKDDLSLKLGEWADVISSVSIFVSSPFRTYDQEGMIESTAKSVWSPSDESMFYGTLSGLNKKFYIHENMNLSPNDPGSHVLWNLPRKESGDIMSDVAGCSLFYKYVSYTPEFIDTVYNWVIEPDDTGVNPVLGIELNETLPDDYMTHDLLIPESSFVYNSRLNISNIRRHLFKGYSAAALSTVGLNGDNIGYYYVYTYIKTLDGTVIVKSPAATSMVYDMYGVYLFYPDSDAYRMVIHDTQLNRYATVPLSEHSGLNGAYYFDGFKEITFQSGTPDVAETELQSEHLPNKLFTSDVNNPFRFPLAGINTVGSGEIVGISAVTRPISQGQFGEYPLIAFCSDGNFALKVDNEGFYSGISPVQEDIVLGGDKITPMENSIALITKKGIMLTGGNDMVQIAPFMSGSMPDISSLDGIKVRDESFNMLMEKGMDTEGFLQYLYGARMAFDYSSDRLFIFNPDKTYCYVYKFDEGTLSKSVFDGGFGIVTSVMDYPDTIVQDGGGVLYSLYGKEDVNSHEGHRYGLAVTRPIKFGHAASLKSIKQIKNMRVHFSKDSFVKYSIYGSNNGMDYYKVVSRFGKPYKFYKLVIYTKLLPRESLAGSVITIEERRTNKIR